MYKVARQGKVVVVGSQSSVRVIQGFAETLERNRDTTETNTA